MSTYRTGVKRLYKQLFARTLIAKLCEMANEVRNILKTCSVCKGTFPTLRELIDHEKRHRLVETPNPVSSIKTRIAANVSTSDTGNGKSVVLYDSFKCPHCPAFVASWSNFGTHLRRWHRDLVETPQLLPRKNVAVNTDPALESPKRQLSEVWRYRCDFCPAAFAHRRTFMQHRLLHLKGKTDDFDGEKDDGKAEMEEAGTEIGEYISVGCLDSLRLGTSVILIVRYPGGTICR